METAPAVESEILPSRLATLPNNCVSLDKSLSPSGLLLPRLQAETAGIKVLKVISDADILWSLG